MNVFAQAAATSIRQSENQHWCHRHCWNVKYCTWATTTYYCQ